LEELRRAGPGTRCIACRKGHVIIPAEGASRALDPAGNATWTRPAIPRASRQLAARFEALVVAAEPCIPLCGRERGHV